MVGSVMVLSRILEKFFQHKYLVLVAAIVILRIVIVGSVPLDTYCAFSFRYGSCRHGRAHRMMDIQLKIELSITPRLRAQHQLCM